MIQTKEKAPATAATVTSAEPKVQLENTTPASGCKALLRDSIDWMLNQATEQELHTIYQVVLHFIGGRHNEQM